IAEGIGKLAGKAKGDRRKEDRRTCRNCRRLPEYAGNLGDDQMLMAGKPPRSAVNHPYQDFPDTVGF
ncbi:hypothetical protein BHE74_00056396, partial [Ensete ventricosum]